MKNNSELYDYLLKLASRLVSLGKPALSQEAIFASSQVSSSSTEFLGEARIALRHVRDEKVEGFAIEEQSELLSVLKQLDLALDKRR